MTSCAWLCLAASALADAFPGASWETQTPAEAGLDPGKLAELASLVGGSGMIVRSGYQVYTWGNVSQTHNWASASKPVLATLLFRAEQLGATDLESPIGEFLPGGSPSDSAITFFQLINMTSGYSRGEAADTAWAYNDYGTQLLGYVLFDRVYGQTPQAAFQAQLGVLQFEDTVTISPVQIGRITQMSTRDFARIGLLWLNQGSWDGTTLVPAARFVNLVTNQVPPNLPVSTLDGPESWDLGTFGGSDNQVGYQGQGHYGMGFWVNTDGFFGAAVPANVHAAIGHVGTEVCFVFPDLDLVAIGKGGWGHPATAAVQLLQEAVIAPVGVEPQIRPGTWGAIKSSFREP
jgi:CubicO group peptidase (beta-lactamase class C family)